MTIRSMASEDLTSRPPFRKVAHYRPFRLLNVFRGGHCRAHVVRRPHFLQMGLAVFAKPERVSAAFAPGFIRGATGLELELTKGVGAQLVTEIRVLVETAGQDFFQVGNLAKSPALVVCL